MLTRDSEGHAQSVKTGVLSIPKWFKKEVDLPEALTCWKGNQELVAAQHTRPEEEESVETKGLKGGKSRVGDLLRALGQRTMTSWHSYVPSSSPPVRALPILK